MKIILTEDVKKLGYKDDVVIVKDGYANNFLLPNKLAILATEPNLKMLEETLKQTSQKKTKLKEDAVKVGESLNNTKISLGAKAGANGKIFGSITALQVSNALKGKGFEVDRRKIDFDEDIKNLGTFSATINLHKEVQAKIEIEVVAE